MNKARYLAAVTAVWLLFAACTSEKPKPAPTKRAVPPAANFTIEAFAASDAKDRPEAVDRAKAEAEKIKPVIDAFYNIAFVQPAKWSGGQHPDLAGLFTSDAQGALAANLGGLALTDIAPKITKIAIKEQKILKVSTLVEEDLSPSHAIANVSFVAVGQSKAKGEQPVDVVHTMTLWLRPDAGTWKIWSYSANLKADSRVKAAAWGPLTEERA